MFVDSQVFLVWSLQVNKQTHHLTKVFLFAYSIANDDKSVPRSTSIDVNDRGITIEEKGAISALNIMNSSRADKDDQDGQEGTTTVENRRNEVSEKERDMDYRLEEKASMASNQQSSSQGKSKKKKKKKKKKGFQRNRKS